MFVLFILLGSVIAIGTFLSVYATVELKKQNALLDKRLKAHADSAGMKVFKQGLGWVPADGTCIGR